MAQTLQRLIGYNVCFSSLSGVERGLHVKFDPLFITSGIVKILQFSIKFWYKTVEFHQKLCDICGYFSADSGIIDRFFRNC